MELAYVAAVYVGGTAVASAAAFVAGLSVAYFRRSQSTVTKKPDIFIGKGGYGTVYKEVYSNGTVKARKDVSLKGMTPVARSKSLREVRNWIKLQNHENIVIMFYYAVENEILHIHMQYIPDGDLDRWLNNINCRSVTKAKTIFWDIITGLTHIHNNRLIHRDLKPANILLIKTGDSYRAKIGDFGLLTDGNPDFLKSTDKGTDFYKSPEQRCRKNYSYPTDIYSAGIILYEMLYCESGNRSDSGLADPEYYFKMYQLETKSEFPSNYCATQEEKQLILGMVNMEPMKRPKALDVMQIITSLSS